MKYERGGTPLRDQSANIEDKHPDNQDKSPTKTTSDTAHKSKFLSINQKKCDNNIQAKKNSLYLHLL